MAKDLTAGFDIAAHVSPKTLERIFQSYYWLGNFPSYVEKPFEIDGTPEKLEIFFAQPLLKLVTSPPLVNAVELTFPFIVRLTNRNDEYAGNASIAVGAEKQTSIVGSELATILVISFAGLGPTAFDIDLSQPFPEFEPLVKTTLLASLLAASEPIVLTPPAAAGAGFFDAKTYVKADAAKSFLGVFVNADGTQTVAPAQMASFLSPGEEGVAIAIPIELVKQSIAAALAAQGLDSGSLPTTLDIGGGETVEVQKLSITVEEDYIQVIAEIDDVEIDAHMGLSADDAGLHAHTIWFDVDMPWYLDLFSALTGGAIQRALEDAIPKGLSSIGDVAVSGLSLFGDTIPGNNTHVEIHNDSVEIRKLGIIVHASVEPVFEALTLTQPTYLRGHMTSREFHKTGCYYGDRIKLQNAARLIHERAAIRQGFNGCYTCANNYSHPMARVAFGFRTEGMPANQTTGIEIELDGELLQPVVIDGIVVTDPPFARKSTYKRKVGADGIWEQFDYDAANQLTPGQWRFTARAGGWTGEATLYLKKTATHFGGTNYVAFTIGNPVGNTGFAKMPAFPGTGGE